LKSLKHLLRDFATNFSGSTYSNAFADSLKKFFSRKLLYSLNATLLDGTLDSLPEKFTDKSFAQQESCTSNINCSLGNCGASGSEPVNVNFLAASNLFLSLTLEIGRVQLRERGGYCA
jgi:hypothetical protein